MKAKTVTILYRQDGRAWTADCQGSSATAGTPSDAIIDCAAQYFDVDRAEVEFGLVSSQIALAKVRSRSDWPTFVIGTFYLTVFYAAFLFALAWLVAHYHK